MVNVNSVCPVPRIGNQDPKDDLTTIMSFVNVKESPLIWVFWV